MATLRKRGQRWHVQVRRKGRTSVTRSFSLKPRALAWAREQEFEADQGRPQAHRTLRGITVADIVSRYRDEVVPCKRGADRETLTLNAFLRHPLARVALGDVTTGMVSAYCTERLQRVQPGTLNRELDILRHAFVTARRNWDVPLTRNPFGEVIRSKAAPPRERRLQPGEQERLMSACVKCRNRFVHALVQFGRKAYAESLKLIAATNPPLLSLQAIYVYELARLEKNLGDWQCGESLETALEPIIKLIASMDRFTQSAYDQMRSVPVLQRADQANVGCLDLLELIPKLPPFKPANTFPQTWNTNITPWPQPKN